MTDLTSGDDSLGTPLSGRSLREVRAEQQLTIRDLARRAGVAPTTLHDIESGILNPGPRVIQRIAAALDVEPGQIAEFRPRPVEVDEDRVIARLEAMGYPRALAMRIARGARRASAPDEPAPPS